MSKGHKKQILQNNWWSLKLIGSNFSKHKNNSQTIMQIFLGLKVKLKNGSSA